MTAPSIGIKDLLVAAGVAAWDSTDPSNLIWPIYLSKLPAAPNQCISIYDGGGQAPNPKWLLDYPNITIMVRSQAYLDAYNKAKDIKSVLVGLPSQTINGDRWDQVNQIGNTPYLGRDSKDRNMFSLNLALIIEPAATSLDNRLPL